MMKKFALAVTAVLPMAFAAPVLADDGPDYQAMVAKTVDQYILPSSSAFVGQTKALQKQAQSFCKAPSAQGLTALQASFGQGLQAWQKLQFVTFGPVEKGNRGQRVYFWPDKKNAGDRQMGMLLRNNKVDDVLGGKLGQSSVAIQGLPALEALLFTPKYADVLVAGGDNGKAHCQFVMAIADNLVGLSTQLDQEWSGPKGWAVTMKNAGQAGNHYTDPRQAASQIYNALYTQLVAVADVKLAHALGDEFKSVKVFRFESYKSKLSGENIVTNLQSIRQAMVDGGWIEVAGEGGLDFLGSLDVAIAAAKRLSAPLEDLTATEKGWVLAQMTKDAVKAAANVMDRNVGPVLDLQVGFNALDGD